MPIDFVADEPATKIDFTPDEVDFGAFAGAPDTTVISSPLSGGLPTLPYSTAISSTTPPVGSAASDEPNPDAPVIEIGKGAPVKLPTFGEEGTLLRGASEVLSGLGEWAVNKPEEVLAAMYPPTSAALLARYAPGMAAQFTGDVFKGLQGDRQALGRAGAMAALVGLPMGSKELAKAKERTERSKAEMFSADEAARKALDTREAPGLVVEPTNKAPIDFVPDAESAPRETSLEATEIPAPPAAEVLPLAAKAAEELGVSKAPDAPRAIPVTEVSKASPILDIPRMEDAIAEKIRTQGEVASGDYTDEGMEKVLGVKSAESLQPLIDVGLISETPEHNFRFSDEIQRKATPKALPQETKIDFTPESSGGEEVPAAAEVTSPPAGQVEPAGTPEIIGMGGAVPDEFVPRGGTPTSNKNAVVDAERAKRGLEPMMAPMKRDFGEAWDRAMARIDQDPGYQDRLVSELQETPRPIDDIENAALLQRRTDLRNEYEKSARDAAQAYEDGRTEDLTTANERTAQWSQKLGELEQVLGRGEDAAGTLLGRGLSARRMMMNEDFSLASLEMQKRAANDWRPVTDQERLQLQETARRFEDLSKQLQESLAAKEKDLVESNAKRAMAELQAQAVQTKGVSDYVLKTAEKWVAQWGKEAEVARKELAGKFLSPSPADLLKLAKIVRFRIGEVGLEVAKITADLVAEFGEGVRPYIEGAFKTAQEMIEKAGEAVPKHLREKVKAVVTKATPTIESVTDKIGAKIDKNEAATITPQVKQLAEMFWDKGVRELNPMIDALQGVLKKFFPEISRQETMDALSGRGKFTLPSQEAVKKGVRDLSTQARLVAHQIDVEAKRPLPRTGYQPDPMSDAARRELQRLEELKRKFGVVVTDPVKQLQSALNALKTYVRNRMADLRAEITTRERIVRSKTQIKPDAELEAMRKELKALEAEHEAIFPKTGLTDEQRIAGANKALDRAIANLESDLGAGKLFPDKKASKTPSTPELVAKRARLEALRDQRQELRDLDVTLQAEKEAARLKSQQEALAKTIAEQERRLREGDLASKPRAVNRPAHPELEALKQRRDQLNKQLADLRKGPAKTPFERALQSRKTRMTNRIAELEEKIAAGDFTLKTKTPPAEDAHTITLEHKLEEVRKRFYEGLLEDKMRKRSIPQKIFGGFAESLNAMRALITSADLSAVLRQGKFVVLAHPVRGARSIPAMLKALGSERAQFAVQRQIEARPNYRLYKSSKLYLSEHGVSLAKMEEAYMSRWASKIPLVGRVVKSSERAYVTFLNKLRADSFDAMANTLGKGGKVSIEESKVLSNFINVATGRGTIGMADQAAVGLNTVFFAPRFVASRFQMVLGQPLYYGLLSGKAHWSGTKGARLLVASEYARIFAGSALVYGLGLGAGGTIETDPRSTEFGKIKFGNTRIDPMAGVTQVTVLLSRLATGEKKTASGRIMPLRSERPRFGSENAFQVLARFGRMKLAPAPAAALDLLTGTDVIGAPVTPLGELKRVTVPISITDVAQTMKEQGMPMNVIVSVLAIFGESVQNYDARKRPGAQ